MAYGLVFDCDGVLADTEALICQATMNMFREEYGVEMKPEDFTPFIGRGPARYTAGPAEKYGVEINLIDAMRKRQEHFVKLLDQGVSIPFEGVNELIEAASHSGDWKLAIATSSEKEKSLKSMRAAQVPYDRFEAHIAGEMVSKPKPHPEIYLKAAEAIGISPVYCIGVEDSISGVDAVKAAGMTCIAVTNSFSRDKLGKADVIVDSLAEVDLGRLYELVESLSKA